MALAGLVCNIVGLAALHGLEAAQLLLDRAGADHTTTTAAFDALTDLPVGKLELVLFLGGNLIGSAALIWAQFRTRTLPWHVPILNVLGLAADVAIPDEAPPAVKAAGISLFVIWSVALAFAIRRPSRRGPLFVRS